MRRDAPERSASASDDARAGGRGAGAARPAGPLTRWVFLPSGLALLGVGVVGAVTPGLPTLVPLMAALYLLARVNPRLERRVRRMRILRPYIRMIDSDAAMPRSARVACLLLMWGSIALSALLIARTLGPLGVGALVLAGVIGTVAILRFRRKPRAEGSGCGPGGCDATSAS